MERTHIRFPEIEEFQYHSGQLLNTHDFNDNQKLKNALRWMHNTALHNSWGVAVGFEPELKSLAVQVSPGIAYDQWGHEIILTKSVEIPLPPKEVNTAILVIQRQQPVEPDFLEHQQGACCQDKSVQLLGVPEFLWRREDNLKPGQEIPIATYDENDAKKIKRYIGSEARAYARPRIGFGTTQPEVTAWKKWKAVWKESQDNKETTNTVVVGLEVEIDTSNAGFTEMPCYFAWLNTLDQFDAVFPLISLADESLRAFTFRILLPNNIMEKTVPSPQQANELKLTVCWLGLETVSLASR